MGSWLRWLSVVGTIAVDLAKFSSCLQKTRAYYTFVNMDYFTVVNSISVKADTAPATSAGTGSQAEFIRLDSLLAHSKRAVLVRHTAKSKR